MILLFKINLIVVLVEAVKMLRSWAENVCKPYSITEFLRWKACV